MADDREPPVERTTIVETNGGGSGGVLAVVLLIIVVLVLLFLFRDQLGFGGDDTDITIPDKVEVNVNEDLRGRGLRVARFRPCLRGGLKYPSARRNAGAA